MRSMLLLVPLALVPVTAPAQAEDSLVVHGWGYTQEEDGIYVSRGFCDATASGGMAYETTLTCYLQNVVDPNTGGITVTGSTPTFATASVEAQTDWRGRLCYQAKTRYASGVTVYYPGPGPADMECTWL